MKFNFLSLFVLSLVLNSCANQENFFSLEDIVAIEEEDLSDYEVVEDEEIGIEDIKINLGWQRHFELIEVHIANDELIEALELAVDALTDLNDSEYQEQIVLLRHLTTIYLNLGDFEIAEYFIQQIRVFGTLDIDQAGFEETGVCDHGHCPVLERELLIAIVLSTLAELYFDEGDLEQGVIARQEALDLFANVWGIISPDTAVTMILLANVYDRNGQYELAEELRAEAFAIFQDSIYDIVIGYPYYEEPIIDNFEEEVLEKDN